MSWLACASSCFQLLLVVRFVHCSFEHALENEDTETLLRSQFRICDNPINGKPAKNHPITSRGLENYHCFIPPWSDWNVKQVEVPGQMSAGMRILEIGIGGARAMLELNAKNPLLNISGLNKDGYGFAQVQQTNQMWDTARRYNITLQCDTTGTPVWPRLLLLSIGIQGEPLPAPRESLDFVLSRFALGIQARVRPNQAQIPFQRVLPTLKEGGSAILQIGTCFPNAGAWAQQEWVQAHGHQAAIVVLRVWNFGIETSAVLLANVNVPHVHDEVKGAAKTGLCRPGKSQCFTVVIKKCFQTSERHPETKDCILPSSVEIDDVPASWTDAVGRANVYQGEYISRLQQHMDRWEREGAVDTVVGGVSRSRSSGTFSHIRSR